MILEMRYCTSGERCMLEGIYLNDLVARKLQCWNGHSITSHKITVENTQNRFVSNDQQVILLALEFEDDRLEADGKVMVGLYTCQMQGIH